MKWITLLTYWLAFVLPAQALAFDAFTIKDIRLEGLRRISAGTVFNSLPVKIGDQFQSEDAKDVISKLYKTGFFKDIRLERQNEVLIVRVIEHPAISKITFNGNTEIETQTLIDRFRQLGFAHGRIFNRSMLEKVELELQRQYFDLGKYGVRIESTVTPLERNLVAIQIDISEGVIAQIKHINFVGNQTVSDDELLDQMKLTTSGWFTFFTESDQYSSLQLEADQESLRSYYLDNGYLNLNIDSVQVSITPDKKRVYLTINLTEGDQYTLSEIKIIGNLIVDEAELFDLLTFKSGQVFSRKEISRSIEAIRDRIGDEGYYFANINPIPEIDSENKTVALKLFIDPGKRIYVRQLNFINNIATRDEVLRREMRQMEGAWISTKDVKRSLTRLERLNYFDQVTVEVSRVDNTSDLVDLNYRVMERPSGNIMAGVGYSQTGGVLFNASLVEDNFLGTGKRVGLRFDNSRINKVYSFSYLNPYITIDGISRGFNLFYRTINAEEANLSRYTTDAYGSTLTYGLPLTEFNFVKLGGSFDNLKLNPTDYSAREVFDFIENNGDSYNSYSLTGSFQHDTRNRVFFPDNGTLQVLYGEITLPFSDLDYYKLGYRHQWLYPLVKDYTLSLKGRVEFGDGYGDHEHLPFFKGYTAGGPRSVRGFRENTLGPLDSNRLPLGGELRVIGNTELILPLPFTKQIRSFRLSAFLDAGNVYKAHEDFDTDELRYSSGLSAIWLTPVGVLTFSWAKPLNEREGDQIQNFQFTIGTTFNW